MAVIAYSLYEVMEHLSQGDAIAFGKLWLDLEGLWIEDRHLSWAEFEEMDVSYGDSAPPVVVIYQRGWRSHSKPEVWAMLSINQISSLPLLMLVMGEIGEDGFYLSA